MSDRCTECDRDMGYGSPSAVCAPCTLGIRPEELCPVCAGPFGDNRVFNPIIGQVCSVECLQAYWDTGGK
jgi:hypothetical protein